MLLCSSDGVGYFAGAPEGMMNVVRKAEKGVEKVSDLQQTTRRSEPQLTLLFFPFVLELSSSV